MLTQDHLTSGLPALGPAPPFARKASKPFPPTLVPRQSAPGGKENTPATTSDGLRTVVRVHSIFLPCPQVVNFSFKVRKVRKFLSPLLKPIPYAPADVMCPVFDVLSGALPRAAPHAQDGGGHIARH